MYAFVVIFPICELGQQLRNAFDEICTTIYQMDWYSFPTQTQRILAMILLGAQTPVQIGAYGNIEASRETCKKVLQKMFFFGVFLDFKFFDYFQIVNGGFSYFMILRKFR